MNAKDGSMLFLYNSVCGQCLVAIMSVKHYDMRTGDAVKLNVVPGATEMSSSCNSWTTSLKIFKFLYTAVHNAPAVRRTRKSSELHNSASHRS